MTLKSHFKYAVNNTKNKTKHLFEKRMKCINLFIKTIQIHKYSNSQNILKPNDINSSKLQKSAPETSSLQEVQRQKRNILPIQ